MKTTANMDLSTHVGRCSQVVAIGDGCTRRMQWIYVVGVGDVCTDLFNCK